MYKFYYDFVKKKCKKCILLFTDTDSLCIETGEDFYEIMHEFKELFDLRNFPKNSKYFCNDNKKVPGKMKDEYEGTAIYEYIGLKPRMYSIRDIHNHEKSVYKGHNSDIKYDEFKDTHSNENIIRHDMRGIKSRDHTITTYEKNKIYLSAFDDKRYIFDDGIITLPYGHKGIPKNVLTMIKKENNKSSRFLLKILKTKNLKV